MPRKRRFAIVTLFVATLFVAITAIYVGIKLSEQPDVAPEKFSALDNLPICFSDDFEGVVEPDSTNWNFETTGDGFATVSSGNLVLFVQLETGTSEPRHSRLVTTSTYSSDFIAEVEFVNILRSGGGTTSPENGISELSFPYDIASSTSLGHYKVEAYITGTGANQMLEIKGSIYTTEQTIQIPVSGLTPPWVKVKIERELTVSPQDIVGIFYDTGSGYQELMTATVQSYTGDGAFVLEARAEDEFDVRPLYDEFVLSCGSPISTIVPTTFISPTAVTTPVTTVEVTPTPTVETTIVVTPTLDEPTPTSTFVTPTTSGGSSPTNIPVVTDTPFPTADLTPKGESLPSTAIVNDEVDKLIFSTMLVLIGFSLLVYSKKYSKQ